MSDQELEHKVSSLYWLDGVCIHDGQCWATEMILIEAKGEEKRRWDVKPILLGREEDLVDVLKRKMPIPDDIHPRIKAKLEEILEEDNEPATGTRSIPRERTTRGTRTSKRNTRRTKAQ